MRYSVRWGMLTATLLFSLSPWLGGCTTSRDAAETVRPQITSEVPQRYRLCATLAKLPDPKGGWTLKLAMKALLDVRASEITKRDCLLDLTDYTEGLLHGIRGGE